MRRMFSALSRIAIRSFAEAAPKAATPSAQAAEDPIKKIFLNKLQEYAKKKPKDFDAKQLAEALKKKN